MDLRGACAVVTGGGHGIGHALVNALAQRGARVVVADLNQQRADRVAAEVEGRSAVCDVGDPDSMLALVATAEEEFGPVEVFCSNAGMLDQGRGLDSTSDQVRRIVDVNLLAHVWAAQAVVPGMVQRGHGWFVPTISSAALVSGPMDLGYTFTKHGALGVAEWLYLNYAEHGLQVVCLCPSAVNTGMLGRDEDAEAAGASRAAPAFSEAVEPEVCAERTMTAMEQGQFLVLPHERVAESYLAKAMDYDAWLAATAERTRMIRAAMQSGR